MRVVTDPGDRSRPPGKMSEDTILITRPWTDTRLHSWLLKKQALPCYYGQNGCRTGARVGGRGARAKPGSKRDVQKRETISSPLIRKKLE